MNNANMIQPKKLRAIALIGVGVLTLAAGCSGSSGPATQTNPAAPPDPGSGYTGPAPSSPDVQQFKINLFDNIRTDNRCGSCHGVDGAASTKFARSDDVNLAYAEANTVVDLLSPSRVAMSR